MKNKNKLCHKKNFFAAAIAAIVVMSMTMTASAEAVETANTLSVSSPESAPSIYSPEFPDAYILLNETIEMSVSDSTTQTVSATVFVEEEYGFDDGGNPITISSRLLLESEVLAIGLENFRNMEDARQDAVSELMQTRTAVNSRGSLVISFSGSYSRSGSKVTANLTGNASWSPSGLFWHIKGEDNPGPGTDYMGVTWSGGFTTPSTPSIKADYTSSGFTELPLLVMCDSVPNAGRVWEFYEYWEQYMLGGTTSSIHVTNIDLDITLSKNNIGNDTAEAVLKYIHTYETAKGSISITANSNGVGGGFVLNSVSKQWSIVCTLTGIPC